MEKDLKMEATTKQLREIASVRQRAEERANSFMKFANGVKSIHKALETIPDRNVLIETINKANL